MSTSDADTEDYAPKMKPRTKNMGGVNVDNVKTARDTKIPRLQGHLACATEALKDCVECFCAYPRLHPLEPGDCRVNCTMRIANRADNWEAAIKRGG